MKRFIFPRSERHLLARKGYSSLPLNAVYYFPITLTNPSEKCEVMQHGGKFCLFAFLVVAIYGA